MNDFSLWLQARGFSVGRNAAVDLGLEEPPVIIEAKQVETLNGAIREAVGQLYEYRYFQVANPGAALVFLSSVEIPKEWLDYLEKDRSIAVVWRAGQDFHLTSAARAAFGLQ